MLLVNHFKVLKRNLALFRSLSLYCPFMASFRRASKVNNFGFVDFGHAFETGVKRLENLVFSLVHVSQILHEFRKHVFVCEDASLRYFDFVWEPLDGLVKFLNACGNSIDLERKTPSGWFFVVSLQHIDIFAAEVLPLRNRLFNTLGLRHLLAQDFKEGGFAAAYIPFYCVTVVFFG